MLTSVLSRPGCDGCSLRLAKCPRPVSASSRRLGLRPAPYLPGGFTAVWCLAIRIGSATIRHGATRRYDGIAFAPTPAGGRSRPGAVALSAYIPRLADGSDSAGSSRWPSPRSARRAPSASAAWTESEKASPSSTAPIAFESERHSIARGAHRRAVRADHVRRRSRQPTCSANSLSAAHRHAAGRSDCAARQSPTDQNMRRLLEELGGTRLKRPRRTRGATAFSP